jgi:Tol biopolymer transport system component
VTRSPGRGTGPRRSLPAALPVGLPVGPALAAVVLLAIAIASFSLLSGNLPVSAAPADQAKAGNVPNRTPDPIKPFQPAVSSAPHVRGSILFAKAGNLWTASGDDVLAQLTTDGTAGSPVWSPDGKSVVFVQTVPAHGAVPCSLISASGCIGAVANYHLAVPTIVAMPATGGSGRTVATGLYSFSGGRYSYNYGLYQPALSPDGKTVAVISDAPDPLGNDYLVQLLSMATGKLRRLALPDDSGLGLNDPAWSPTGAQLAYTWNHLSGPLGVPQIAILDVRSGQVHQLAGRGYAQPSWSPNGKYLAAVKSDAKGRNVVILDASSGAELLRLTGDGASFAPIWSPAGDQIAFLRADGLTIDLWVDTLSGSGRAFTVADEQPLTSQSQLDGTSKPSWYVPADQMPAPGAASPGASAGSGGPPGGGASAPAASPQGSAGP